MFIILNDILFIKRINKYFFIYLESLKTLQKELNIFFNFVFILLLIYFAKEKNS
jgi:hypothetical protein